MLIVALNGSPRPDGNTQILLDEALSAALKQGADILRIDLATMRVADCKACEGCKKRKSCVIKDDMTLVYDLLDKADALIVGTPIYFSGPSGYLKTAIDRCQMIWNRGPVRSGRPAAMFAVGGDPEVVFRNALSEVRSFLKVVGFECRHELFVPGIEHCGDVRKHEDLLKKARVIGRDLAHQSS